MKYKLTLFLLVAIISISLGQSSKKNKREIKIGLNGNFALFTNPTEPLSFFFRQQKTFYFTSITPTISFRQTKKRRVHEIEPQLWFSKETTDAYEIKKSYAAFRYSLTKYFKKQPKHFRFRWGSSYQIFYYNSIATAETQTQRYSTEHFRSGLRCALVGHIEWHLKERLSLELFTHLISSSISIDFTENFDPNPAPFGRSRTGGFDFTARLIPVLPLMRLGLHYTL